MTEPLLIEIGVEELPAIPFLKELPNIEKKWFSILEEYNLECEFDFFYTPRRFVFWHREFPKTQKDSVIEHFGAPVSIAFKDGNPTNAAISFAKKCSVEVQELGRTTKDGKEILYFSQTKKGQESASVLNEMINKLFGSFNFGKSMRWGDRSDSFIRPIRWVCAMMSDKVVPVELFGKVSKAQSYGHRMVSFEPFDFGFCGEYFCKLDKMGVILDQDQRKKIILEQIKNIEIQNCVTVEIDEELLAEVIAITENPTALLGSFEEHFLDLPPEVIITSMKTNQRYFAVFKNDCLANKFVVVANAISNDFSLIVNGNERVLRPRLSDAMFFYKNDLKNGFAVEDLKNIVYMDGLGTIFDKVQREVKIASYLSKIFGANEDVASRAAYLAKADLLTQVVYEFTELQGLVGSYYAKIFGENDEVALAIKEQYFPIGEKGELPTSLESAIVAMSNKLDTLMAIFSVGKLPSGNKDPFALRRAAAGVLKIAIEQKLDFDLKAFFEAMQTEYKQFDLSLLNDFVNERFMQILGANPSVFKAVLGSGDTNIKTISQKIEALTAIVNSADFKEISSTFKRVANITKDVNLNEIKVNQNLFEQDEEKNLFGAFEKVSNTKYDFVETKLDALFGLKPELDAFFDKVFVNHENEEIKNNRKSLVSSVYVAFKTIADIKEITL